MHIKMTFSHYSSTAKSTPVLIIYIYWSLDNTGLFAQSVKACGDLIDRMPFTNVGDIQLDDDYSEISFSVIGCTKFAVYTSHTVNSHHMYTLCLRQSTYACSSFERHKKF